MLGISYGEVFLLLGATAALVGIFLMAQLEAIRHEIRNISFVNPGPLTKRLVDNLDQISTVNVGNAPEKEIKETKSTATNYKAHTTAAPDRHSQSVTVANLADSMALKDQNIMSTSTDMHSQSTAYARLAESASLNPGPESSDILRELVDESGHVIVLPVSAETAELLPKREADVKGSDIVLEAVLEAEVARNAKEFFSQPQNLKPQ